MIVPYLVVSLYGAGGVAYVLGFLVGLLVLQAAIVAGLGIETNRRSLEALRPSAASLS